MQPMFLIHKSMRKIIHFLKITEGKKLLRECFKHSCKEVPDPLLKAPTPLSSLTPFFKSLCPIPLFSVSPLLRYFGQYLPPSQPPSAIIQLPTNLLGLNKYQKSNFKSSTVFFYQKSIFNLLNPFTNRLS